MSLSICCLMADRLSGSFLQRKEGSRSLLLKPDSAASFARLSATSFPVNPMWPVIQVRVTSISGWFAAFCLILFAFSLLCILPMSCLISSIRYCADCRRLLSAPFTHASHAEYGQKWPTQCLKQINGPILHVCCLNHVDTMYM